MGAVIRARRTNAVPEAPVVVQTWGEEPIGAMQIEGWLARTGADMAGFTGPTPAGWGLSGSQERTDQTIWANPQAFNGLAGEVALSTLVGTAGGAVAPIVYPWAADDAGITLPGPNGV
jgi:hypothetical protein